MARITVIGTLNPNSGMPRVAIRGRRVLPARFKQAAVKMSRKMDASFAKTVAAIEGAG